MGMFDGMKQPELQQACRDRQIPLPSGASNADLVRLLDAYEASLLSDLGESVVEVASRPVPVPDGDTGDAPPPPAPAPATPAAPEATETATDPTPVLSRFEMVYPCPALLSTEQHESLRYLAYDRAVAAGHQPKGGLAGVSRTGFRDIDGVRHAVYTVVLRKG